jgi:serine protease AprX
LVVSRKVLVEIAAEPERCFHDFEIAAESEAVAMSQARALLDPLAGLGLETDEDVAPVPLLSTGVSLGPAVREALRAFPGPQENPDLPAVSMVIAAEIARDRLEELAAREGVTVWPNSEIALIGTDRSWELPGSAPVDEAIIDAARSRGGVDCGPFRAGVDLATIRQLLGVEDVWRDGWRGQNVTVAVLDDGIDGSVYPVSGGFHRPAARRPGAAAITSHGSMCAADVLVAAPWARLQDYPFLDTPRSGGALAMFQAVLGGRRREGLPHVTTNSWGLVGVPPREQFPGHEAYDLNHPLHRKIREVVASGVITFFAAGNCGRECPAEICHVSGIGPGSSIHASNSLEEVITIAAVNSRHERLGYSSQGEGLFAPEKPDLAAYSHFFGNFGPDRPGGLVQPFDSGTSAAAPLAAGVGALLLSAFRDLEPAGLREILVAGATRMGDAAWDRDYGQGIINAAASYTLLRWADR